MSLTIKRDGTGAAHWRGHKIGVIERVEDGWRFTADVNPTRPMTRRVLLDLKMDLTRDLVQAERKRATV